MKILVIGGGGREHAIAWKLAQSAEVSQIFVAPGNAGTALEPKVSNLDLAANDIAGLLKFAQEEGIDLTIVGPEEPLVLGLVDEFRRANLLCLGPKQVAAQLEGSKSFCKDFCYRHQIPTAAYRVFTEFSAAVNYLDEINFPVVIKADGLAAGKGVSIVQNKTEGLEVLKMMLAEQYFGAAASKVVIEEFLEGEELSFIILTDGKTVRPLVGAQDHKARDEGDCGPNTGGMGAYSPVPILDENLYQQIMEQIIQPTIAGLNKDQIEYTGFLYAGLMITKNGPQLLEFNCRLGDPEAEVILMRLETDLAQLAKLVCQGKLHEIELKWDPRIALGIVLASRDYPFSYPKGEEILGLEKVSAQDCKVFHAGTILNSEKKVCTNGGRVLCLVQLGDSIGEVQQAAYTEALKITWPSVFYRRDIGNRAFLRAEKNK